MKRKAADINLPWPEVQDWWWRYRQCSYCKGWDSSGRVDPAGRWYCGKCWERYEDYLREVKTQLANYCRQDK